MQVNELHRWMHEKSIFQMDEIDVYAIQVGGFSA